MPTKEQDYKLQIHSDYQLGASSLRNSLEKEFSEFNQEQTKMDHFLRFFEYFSDAGSSIGLSEIAGRKGERYEIFAGDAGRIFLERRSQLNNRALSQLENAKSEVEMISDEHQDYESPGIANDLFTFFSEFRWSLIEIDLKGADILEINNEIRSIFYYYINSTGGDGDELTGILEYIKDRTNNLIDVRRDESRGVQTNIEPVSLAIIGIFLATNAVLLYARRRNGEHIEDPSETAEYDEIDSLDSLDELDELDELDGPDTPLSVEEQKVATEKVVESTLQMN